MASSSQRAARRARRKPNLRPTILLPVSPLRLSLPLPLSSAKMPRHASLPESSPLFWNSVLESQPSVLECCPRLQSDLCKPRIIHNTLSVTTGGLPPPPKRALGRLSLLWLDRSDARVNDMLGFAQRRRVGWRAAPILSPPAPTPKPESGGSAET